MTQDQELEEWYGKDGKREPTVADYLGGRSETLPERHDIFHEYREWIISAIIPALLDKWELPVTVYITGWRPHQHEIWDCEPGEKPVQRPVPSSDISYFLQFCFARAQSSVRPLLDRLPFSCAPGAGI
jgi:hypothetical protein